MASSVPVSLSLSLFNTHTHTLSQHELFFFWEMKGSGAGITSNLHVIPQLHHQNGLYPHLITFLLQGSGSAFPGLTATSGSSVCCFSPFPHPVACVS